MVEFANAAIWCGNSLRSIKYTVPGIPLPGIPLPGIPLSPEFLKYTVPGIPAGIQLTPIAALRDVVGTAGNYEARQAGHSASAPY